MSSDITNEIRLLIDSRLNQYNRERSTENGRYIIVAPNKNTLYYTLWLFYPEAVYHKYVFITNLELSALGSVETAMKVLTNSFLSLEITDSIDAEPNNGDDLIMFGKYRGAHLWDIYRTDPRYIQWIAEKFVPQVRSEFRFKELAETYNKIYLDLLTRKNYKKPASRFVGAIGDKLTNLQLQIVRVRIEDDIYKTKTVNGVIHYYVDQLVTAIDESGNLFFLIIKATDRSLTTQTIAASDHPYQVGEMILLLSAKVMKHNTSHDVQYTKLGYLKFPKKIQS